MPRGRSLFSSLPKELKWSIRQTPKAVDFASREIKEENVSAFLQSELLSTQPASPGSEESDIVGENIVVDLRSPPPTRAPGVADSQAGPSKRSIPTLDETPSGSSTPQSHSKGTNKKRKRKSVPDRQSDDKYKDHPWDCTGLVTRYQDYAEVPDKIRKYFSQRYLYFPLYDVLPLLLDDTGWFSITPHPIAQHIAHRCQSDTIIDAFCGVGGNAIEFAKTCERVIAIDNDPIRLRLARHNALHCGVADRIDFVLGDFVAWAEEWVGRSKSRTEKQNDMVDVVFLSPPWGGIEYLQSGEKYPLSRIEPIPGDKLFELSSQITPNIAYFLPKNTDLGELANLGKTLDKPERDGSGGSSRQREWVEIEEEWVGDKLKAITAYFGGLVGE